MGRPRHPHGVDCDQPHGRSYHTSAPRTVNTRPAETWVDAFAQAAEPHAGDRPCQRRSALVASPLNAPPASEATRMVRRQTRLRVHQTSSGREEVRPFRVREASVPSTTRGRSRGPHAPVRLHTGRDLLCAIAMTRTAQFDCNSGPRDPFPFSNLRGRISKAGTPCDPAAGVLDVTARCWAETSPTSGGASRSRLHGYGFTDLDASAVLETRATLGQLGGVLHVVSTNHDVTAPARTPARTALRLPDQASRLSGATHASSRQH